MIEAMWTVSFSTPQGTFGSGVAVFETGRIFGGDSMYFYLGSYTVSGSDVMGKALVQHYGDRSPTFSGSELTGWTFSSPARFSAPRTCRAPELMRDTRSSPLP